jgi:hypothetical protein
MSGSRPWPLDDQDRPSGSVRPLSQADLQAILAHLAHLDDDPDQLLAGTGASRPVVAVHVRATVGRPGGSAQAAWRRARAAEWAAWTRTLPWRLAAILGIGAGGGGSWQPAGAPAGPGRCRPGGGGGWLGAAVSSQPGCGRLAAGGGGGATHRPPLGCAGAPGVGGPARPGPPRLAGQPRLR